MRLNKILTRFLLASLGLIFAAYIFVRCDGYVPATQCEPPRFFWQTPSLDEDYDARKFIRQYADDVVGVRSTYCLRDLLEGNPSSGGCWDIVELPAGSTITEDDLDNADNPDNPCIDFGADPSVDCPAVYKFRYYIQCECPDTYATLTICLTCDCDIEEITFNCTPNFN